MPDSSWMFNRLEEEASHHHPAIDAVRLSLLGPNIERARYADYLSRMYAFEGPIEWRWLRTSGVSRLIDVRSRMRSAALAADLAALGRFPDLVPMPAFGNPVEALGWMFVVERGRRMHGMLYRHLLTELPCALAIAGTYLSSSSPLLERWRGLGIVLDELAGAPAIATQIIEAANAAFRALRHVVPEAQAA